MPTKDAPLDLRGRPGRTWFSSIDCGEGAVGKTEGCDGAAKPSAGDIGSTLGIGNEGGSICGAIGCTCFSRGVEGSGGGGRLTGGSSESLISPSSLDNERSTSIGSLFTGRIEGRATVGDRPGIIPSIEGWARVTGFNTIVIDDRDPFAHGFQVV